MAFLRRMSCDSAFSMPMFFTPLSHLAMNSGISYSPWARILYSATATKVDPRGWHASSITSRRSFQVFVVLFLQSHCSAVCLDSLLPFFKSFVLLAIIRPLELWAFCENIHDCGLMGIDQQRGKVVILLWYIRDDKRQGSYGR